jgi:hypothetical protein
MAKVFSEAVGPGSASLEKHFTLLWFAVATHHTSSEAVVGDAWEERRFETQP